MSDKQNSLECNAICWGIAAFVGFVSMIMLYMLADFGALQAIFTGGLLGTILGLVLSLFICRGQKAAHDLAADEKPAQRYAREAAEGKAQREGTPVAAPAAAAAPSAAATTTAAASVAATPATAFAMQPTKELAGQQDLADRKGDWTYGEEADVPAKAADVPAAAAPAAEQAPAAKPKRAAVAADGEPELFESPTDGDADDLKLISGVGPKLEQTLNEMGIWYFKQVAAWRKKEIAWVDDRLRFKGRIERDDWMSQAKILAKGGETEFSKKKKK